MDIALILPYNREKICLLELMDDYSKLEYIKFDEICDKCKKKLIMPI